MAIAVEEKIRQVIPGATRAELILGNENMKQLIEGVKVQRRIGCLPCKVEEVLDKTCANCPLGVGQRIRCAHRIAVTLVRGVLDNV